MIVPDPPVIEQMEVANNGAATNNATEANDSVMADGNMEPEVNVNAEATVTPIISNDVVPSPRPHTMEHAYNKSGELVTVKWPIMVPPTAPGPHYDYHVEQRPQVQKPKPRLPRLPSAVTTQGSFSMLSFREHNTFFDSAKNPYTKPKISSDRFWSHQQRSYYSCILYNQDWIFPHKRLDCDAMAGLPCLEEALDCFRDVGLLPFVTDKEHWNEELLLQFYATLHI